MKVYSMRQRLLATSFICGAMAATAWADTAAAQAAADGAAEVGEIVVTGSRIRRDTFSAPQQLSVVTAEAIRESGNTSIGDILLDQPNINPNQNQQTTSATLFLAGQARADIRGLGATRTLVLMDGRRLPFSDASSPAVDLNTIPSLMIERVETIAGGASAVYGSEAISGVVNFVMKKQQEGLEIDLQTGITEDKDGEEWRAGFNWGKKLFDGRLNVLVGGEYAGIEPIMQKDRDWAFPGIRRNNATGVITQDIVPQSRANSSPFATFQLRSSNVVGTGLAVTRDVRDNGASIARLSQACATATVQPTCQDESLFYNQVFTALQGKSSRAVLRTYVDYKITDNWKAFVDASYVKVSGYGFFGPAFSNAVGGGTMPIVIRGDNAYLNGPGAAAAALRAVWTGAVNGANGQPLPFDQRGAGLALNQATAVQVGKTWVEFGGRDVKTEREQTRVAIGMEGKFETFGREVNWDWYAQHAKLSGSTISYGVPNLARVQQAVDAVLINGQVVCRDAAARAAGCAPWDLVNGQPSREAINWANATSVTDQQVKQTVAGLNFAANLFDLPAGPVGVAVGTEYRKEESFFAQDALGASGALFFNAIGTRQGEYDVKEAYGEIRIPILKDVPFAEELSVELAGRVSDYSSVGGTDQYRLHAEWAPFKDVRFRASQSTAVRAPNIVELFSPQSRNFTTAATDPCDATVFAGATAAQQAARRVTCAAAIPGWNPATFQSNFGTGRSSLALLQGGNPDLDPEVAHSYQYGVIMQPRWVPGLQISADFFKYNVTAQIGTIPINTLFQALCYDSSQPIDSNPFCAQIQRDRAGTNGGSVVGGVTQVVLTNQNVASVKVEGWDYAISYGFHTADLLGKDYGDIALRLDATWMYGFTLQGLPGQAYTQLANTINNGLPEWKANGQIRWSNDKASVTWATLWIDSMIANNALQPNQLNPYKTGDYFRHDLRVTYRYNDQLTMRAGLINVFDRHPPALPETFNGTAPGASQYDNRGRYLFIGAGMNF
ncbi:MAG: TonB-dependent receptor [Alphaproteobacteria bacterium]|nr:TonB-dependent receptor [Alphaproteobacteria bacterium]MBU1513335.1 TonB-dependent receptor [Alphaproteobacteria bacterium]MBU2096327.1 TonB-dependent receptor [Alphaproteobacteria bacterium]MBU2151616.1 TonB-dependent receptor [Alphaproteobacteria bacterium]MBU2309821.1 TonB-dependent receptor [Alphaproteobacteria bacterium]